MTINFLSSIFSDDGQYKMLTNRLSEGVLTIQINREAGWQYFCVLQLGRDGKFRGYTPDKGFLVGYGETDSTFRIFEDKEINKELQAI